MTSQTPLLGYRREHFKLWPSTIRSEGVYKRSAGPYSTCIVGGFIAIGRHYSYYQLDHVLKRVDFNTNLEELIQDSQVVQGLNLFQLSVEYMA